MPTIDRRVTAAAVAIALPLVGAAEGLRQYVYRDPVGIPTFCFGETKNPEWGRRYSLAECQGLLSDRVEQAALEVQRCTTVPLAPHELAARASFAYNVGGAAYCGSTFARRTNAGHGAAACAELNRWVYARGIKLPGLVNRRAAERAMCEGRG